MFDKFQPKYLAHQERKKALFAGEAELVEASKEDLSGPFLELANRRQSQRIFNGERITDRELEYIKSTIVNTPSSCNRQPVQVRIVRTTDDRERLEELLVGGAKWISKANIILLLLADMEAYKSPAEVNFMPYLDAGFIGMSVYYAAEAIGVGCCFVNPNIREENQEIFQKIFNKEGLRMCGAIALGHYDKRVLKVRKSEDIFLN